MLFISGKTTLLFTKSPSCMHLEHEKYPVWPFVYVINDFAGASHSIAFIVALYLFLHTIMPFSESKVNSLTKLVETHLHR